MRALVLELAGRHGYEAREAPLTLEDLRAADALFLTNSVRLLSPVISLEDATFRAPPAAADALRSAILDLILAECGHKVGRPD
jgi:branched-chain amino acid aminotransferase